MTCCRCCSWVLQLVLRDNGGCCGDLGCSRMSLFNKGTVYVENDTSVLYLREQDLGLRLKDWKYNGINKNQYKTHVKLHYYKTFIIRFIKRIMIWTFYNSAILHVFLYWFLLILDFNNLMMTSNCRNISLKRTQFLLCFSWLKYFDEGSRNTFPPIMVIKLFQVFFTFSLCARYVILFVRMCVC